MKEEKNIKVIFIGRYEKSEILAGNCKVAKRIFYNYTKFQNSTFIEYFFDGKEYNYYHKLFGKQIITNVNGSVVYRLGLFKLMKYLFEIKPDIIHLITFERFAVITFLFKLITKVKIIYNIHGIIIFENTILRSVKWFQKSKDYFAEKIFLKYSDRVLFLSGNCKVLIKKYYKINEDKFHKIDNGIDLDFHNLSYKRCYKINSSLRVVFISDIDRKEKGFLLLKNTLEEIDYSIDLYIVDTKNTINNIKFNNKKINVYSYDKMCSSKLAEFLIDKDAFVSSSFYESFSISAVEAMATGIIPILTNETGASVYIKDGINGFTFDYGDKEKLKSIILSFIKNPEIIKNISNRAKEIYNFISWEKISDSYDKVYMELLK